PKGQYYGGGIAAPVSRRVLQAMLAGQDAGLMDGSRRGNEGDGARTPGASLDWSRTTGTGTERGAPAAGLRTRTPAASVFRFAANADAETSGAGGVPGPDSQPAEVPVPDVRGMDIRAAVSRLHELGLKVEIHGSDAVTDQVPAPGLKAVRGASVILR
ncbi:MAG: PASTA domain-containing protein, partial [Gemmatimonadota bacterium]